MDISFDSAKRDLTLRRRGLDFARAGEIFEGETATIQDDKFDYGEERFLTAGYLDGRFVIVVWTPRGDTCRIISMRYAHEHEQRDWFGRMG